MATDVMMPQMGESIAEGTIVRWIKKVGDAVDRDEPLFEISTDKVDAEIPSPSAGVLLEIRVKEGETVPVNSLVAVIGAKGERASSGTTGTTGETNETSASSSSTKKDARPEPARHDSPVVPVVPETIADLRRQKSSPVVRNIAKQHSIDITALSGTGISGRVTKNDILGHIAKGPTSAPGGATVGRPAAKAPAAPVFGPGENVRVEKMSIMRKKIAEHMVHSLQTSAHVYSVFEVDFHRIEQLRQAKKAEYEAKGAKLSVTAFIAKATVDTIREFPMTNASLDGDNVVYKRDINLGIAVALDSGLLVPVIKNADEKNLFGLSKAIQDLAARARSKKLNPEEVQGGTFTITNPGVYGALYGLPIINQPQVAILGVGAIVKRAVVIDDMIAIRPMCHLSIGHDHRLIDGADAARFLAALKDRIENFDENAV